MSRGPIVPRCQLNVRKTQPNAEYPFIEEDQNIGMNLVLISRSDERVDDTVNDLCMFETGISLSPVGGTYGMLIANLELMQKGYTILSPVLIEAGDEEPLKIPLYKFREGPDLELPCTGVKLVMFSPGIPNIIITDRSNSSFQPAPAQKQIQQQQPIQTQAPAQSFKQIKKTTKNHMS